MRTKNLLEARTQVTKVLVVRGSDMLLEIDPACRKIVTLQPRTVEPEEREGVFHHLRRLKGYPELCI